MTAIQIPIRELHARTGHFVRLAAARGEIIVTEHGKPAARLSAFVPASRDADPPTIAGRRRLRTDYQSALKSGKLSGSEDSTPSLHETAALRDL